MDANMFNSIAQNSDNYSNRLSQINSTNITNHLNGMMNTQIGKQIHKTAEDQLNNLLGTSGAEVAGIAAHMAYRGIKYRGAVQQIRADKAVADKEDQLSKVRNLLKKSSAGRRQLREAAYDADPKNFPDNVGFEAAPPKPSSARFTATVTKGIQTRGPGAEGVGGGGGDFDTSRYRYDTRQGRMVSRETGEPVTATQIRQGSSDRKTAPTEVDPEGDLPFGLQADTRSMLDSISQAGSVADKVDLFQQRQPVFKPKSSPIKLAPEVAEPISTQTAGGLDVFGNPLPVPAAAAAAPTQPQGTYRRGGTSIGSTPYNVRTQVEQPPLPAIAQATLEAPSIPAPTLETPSLALSTQARAIVPNVRSTLTNTNIAKTVTAGAAAVGDDEPSLSSAGGIASRGLGGGLAALGAGIQGGKNLGKNLAFAGGQTLLDEVAPGAGSLLSAGQTLGNKALSAGQKAKSIATGAGTLAGVEGAEMLLPGAGEILMGLTAVGGLIADLVEKGQEKAPAPPQMPQTQQLSFDDARPLDSSQYRGPIGGLQQ